MEKLGSKCLIVADSALQKGLPLVLPSKEQPGSGRPSVQEVDGSVKVEGDDGGMVDTEGEEVGDRIDRLSCVAMTWKNSLSSTMDRIDHFKGGIRGGLELIISSLSHLRVRCHLSVMSGIWSMLPCGRLTVLQ